MALDVGTDVWSGNQNQGVSNLSKSDHLNTHCLGWEHFDNGDIWWGSVTIAVMCGAFVLSFTTAIFNIIRGKDRSGISFGLHHLPFVQAVR